MLCKKFRNFSDENSTVLCCIQKLVEIELVIIIVHRKWRRQYRHRLQYKWKQQYCAETFPENYNNLLKENYWKLYTPNIYSPQLSDRKVKRHWYDQIKKNFSSGCRHFWIKETLDLIQIIWRSSVDSLFSLIGNVIWKQFLSFRLLILCCKLIDGDSVCNYHRVQIQKFRIAAMIRRNFLAERSKSIKNVVVKNLLRLHGRILVSNLNYKIELQIQQ